MGAKTAKKRPGKEPGAAKTGGRTKGTPNKSSLYVRAELADAGINLVERFLGEVAQLPSPDLRVAEFRWLFSYVFPKLKEIDGVVVDVPPPPPPPAVTPTSVAPKEEPEPLTIAERIAFVRGQVPNKP